MATAVRQCYRLLKTGSSLVILLNNPRVFSHQGQSYAWGEDNAKYDSGEPLPVRFFGPDGQVTMSFVDTYWSLDDYLGTLRAAGFLACRHFAPPRPCSEEVVREIGFLQDQGVFPQVTFQDYNGEPTVVIVATK